MPVGLRHRRATTSRRCTRPAARALERCDMVLISGGSSVGTRDYTVEAHRPRSTARTILVHGIAISPGKPTILARVARQARLGAARPRRSPPWSSSPASCGRFCGTSPASPRPAADEIRIPARLSRNVASAQGRTDFVRVRLWCAAKAEWWAEPVLGKSGLLNTMIALRRHSSRSAKNVEGLDEGAPVEVILLLDRRCSRFKVQGFNATAR
ncbi:MAG: molybdopterin-binding protein [Desulfobacterales bacterium]|nr:molybdopterin-binding protein [Desulfobacterales bacterium]